ncbi:type I secretion system permease/ATPase, partial [Pseudomonas sp. FW305-130]
IAHRSDGSFAILVRASPTLALVQDPASGQSSRLYEAEWNAVFDGELVLLTTRTSVSGAGRKFDVSWFIPALVRYRGLLGQVILASLVIQIIGLVSPLIFQVVIDKVL